MPQGDGSLPREILGNELLRRTMVLIKTLERAGNFWTLENPASSYVWSMPSVINKLDSPSCEQALMHQCAYGLKLKDDEGLLGPCRKHTRFAGNLPGLRDLSRLCHCRSRHVHAVGGVRTPHGWKRRSELAGHYPLALCHKYATRANRILPLHTNRKD